MKMFFFSPRPIKRDNIVVVVITTIIVFAMDARARLARKILKKCDCTTRRAIGVLQDTM